MRQYLYKAFLALLFVSVLPAWKSLERAPALPPVYANEATIDGMTGVRYATYQPSGIEDLLKDLESSFRVMNRDSPGTPINYLSISGGGSRGAFGAGLLNGWTKSGTRPAFNMVTGVSTGALIAPLAYLGHEYDAVLKQLYTNITADKVYRKRAYTSVLFSDGLSDTTPLYNMISAHITEALLQKIAYEYTVKNR